jgi:putative ABC transport system substrate-binding protein
VSGIAMGAADRRSTLARHGGLARTVALILAIVALLAGPALAASRVLVYATADTPQIRAALAGVREALATTPVEEIPRNDAAARLKAAAAEGTEVAVITFGAHAASRAIREAPTLAAVDCMSTAAAPPAQAVPIAIPFDQQVFWLRRLLPDARYIGILYDPAQNAEAAGALAAALRLADLNPVLAPVDTPPVLPGALSRLSDATDALLAITDSTVYTPQTAKALLLFSFRHKAPLIGPSEAWVQAGALYALDWDYREFGRYCGQLALRQVAGSRIAAPTPPRPHLFINQRSAQMFGLRWDNSMRGSFDRVVR